MVCLLLCWVVVIDFLVGFSVLVVGFICCCLVLVGICCVVFVGLVFDLLWLCCCVMFGGSFTGDCNPLLFGVCLICLSGYCFGVLS